MNVQRTQLAYQERVFLLCTGIFIASLVACNLIFQKFFRWDIHYGFIQYTFEISVGIIPYPVTFLVTDVVSEIYGKKRADQIVVSGLIASLFVLMIISIADAVPQTDWSPVSSDLFHKVFGLTKASVLSSMCAYLAAQFIDIRLFHFWKRMTNGRHLWLRNNASTMTSQFVDTSTVLFLLCLFGTIPWNLFTPLLINGYIFKLIIALCDTPFFYASAWYLRSKMGLQLGEEIAVQQSLA